MRNIGEILTLVGLGAMALHGPLVLKPESAAMDNGDTHGHNGDGVSEPGPLADDPVSVGEERGHNPGREVRKGLEEDAGGTD